MKEEVQFSCTHQPHFNFEFISLAIGDFRGKRKTQDPLSIVQSSLETLVQKSDREDFRLVRQWLTFPG